MSNIEKVFMVAEKEIGTREDPPGSERCKYSVEYGLIGYWCVMFVWWVMKHAGLSKLFYDGGKIASCTALYKFCKSKGLLTTNPVKGDFVLFSWDGMKTINHIGIVEKVTPSFVYTIEGNTHDDSKGETDLDDRVMKRKRSIKYVYAYIHPDYKEQVKGNVWDFLYSQPIDDRKHRIKGTRPGAVFTVKYPAKEINGELWFETVNKTYVKAKCFDII